MHPKIKLKVRFGQSYPGLNIRWPWSKLILEGTKTVETRVYPLPEKYFSKDMALIETYGSKKKAQIVGLIRFENCFKYATFNDWKKDFERHRVLKNDPMFGYSTLKQKWGWVIIAVTKIDPPIPAPNRRGIIFAKSCIIRSSRSPDL